ncbi:hypothetical protein ISN45_Aa06g006500 [Arabidopsis thaliana x Arabidopsis arenosa]|uniref:Uncharacterized protein n=1 Tax=Arabidopsis thaliana x Arabidopsis arenosa TaxID=1240361 RepID=A0A8T1YTK4_9BRAS|nr:hypothetical protein ISN45_Aa06g006500 [Arabidopsis thaliana x Arabidopsis arenosa]
MERRVPNAFPGAPPPVPYYQNNYNNPHHHQTHPPPPQHHHVAAIGFHQYPQNDNRDQCFNQPQYSGQHQNKIVDQGNNAPPPFPPSHCGGGSLRKRRSQSVTDTADGIIKTWKQK